MADCHNVRRMRLTRRALAALCLAAVTFSAAVLAQQKTSEDDARLAKWLKRFPQADANGDGILTMAEANAYRQKLQSKRGGRKAKGKGAAAKRLSPTVKDVRYGPHARDVLDFYKTDSDSPTPVLIYFHGGGFVAGDKSKGASVSISRQCLEAGISVVSANYRLVRDRPGEPGAPFPAPMLDGARVVQFVRFKADEWNIDPKRVALSGGSAGACMSIWIALHDDLADLDADDPVAQLSTRVSAVVAYGGQTTLTPREILKHIGGNPSIHPSLPPFYGVQSMKELGTPEKQKLVYEASAISYATRDDPPLYMRYGGRLDNVPLPPDASTGLSIHHPMFGKLLKDKYDEMGTPCHLVCGGRPAKQDELTFLKEHLGMGGE